MLSDESNIDLKQTNQPEFDGWEWVDYWKPLDDVVFFKRKVYKRALMEFASILSIPDP